jgi:AcrR family transcriptional regulator
LEAASSLFAEKGFDGTSVEEIARRAGFTSGALYSNFKSKEELFLTLLTDRRVTRAQRRQSVIDDIGFDGRSREEALTELFRRAADRRSRFPTLQAEFWLFALRHPEAHAATAAQWRAQRDATSRYLERTQPGVDASRRDDVATAAVAIFQGLIHARRLDPKSVPDELFAQVIAWLFDGASH